jgi:hypothetical protein
MIPKPTFVTCDETSLKITWQDFVVPTGGNFYLQYKEPPEQWEGCREIRLAMQTGEVTFKPADLVDLKPGTPYYVRLSVLNADGTREYGLEAVFDTKPIDCTPRGKRCSIS